MPDNPSDVSSSAAPAEREWCDVCKAPRNHICDFFDRFDAPRSQEVADAE